jgi:alpha-tubulin suppressor-like RCC1 family protein
VRPLNSSETSFFPLAFQLTHKQSPASTPCLVEDLSDLPTGPIRKVSAGGYVAAALTTGNDLYLWGGRTGQPKILECLTGEPTPFDLDGDDVLDVSVGDNHALALSTNHKIFVAGSGSNGQLGTEDREKIEEWTEVVFPLKDNQRAISVHAGYKNSFVLVENIT